MAVKVKTLADGVDILTEQETVGAPHMQVVRVAPASTVTDGRKVVTTAGTRVALAASTACKEVIITAELDNTGIVAVGAAGTVVAALATRTGVPLSAGDSIVLQINNLAHIGLDSIVSGDGVTFMAFS